MLNDWIVAWWWKTSWRVLVCGTMRAVLVRCFSLWRFLHYSQAPEAECLPHILCQVLDQRDTPCWTRTFGSYFNLLEAESHGGEIAQCGIQKLDCHFSENQHLSCSGLWGFGCMLKMQVCGLHKFRHFSRCHAKIFPWKSVTINPNNIIWQHHNDGLNTMPAVGFKIKLKLPSKIPKGGTVRECGELSFDKKFKDITIYFF